MTDEQKAEAETLEANARAIAERYRTAASRRDAGRLERSCRDYAQTVIRNAERRIRALDDGEALASRALVEAGLQEEFDRSLRVAAADLSEAERAGIFAALRRRFDAHVDECASKLASLMATWLVWKRISVWRQALDEFADIEREKAMFELLPADVFDAMETLH